MKHKLAISVFFIVFFLMSCSVERRQYLQGSAISLHKNVVLFSTKQHHAAIESGNAFRVPTAAMQAQHNNKLSYSAAADQQASEPELAAVFQVKTNPPGVEDSCDIIELKNYQIELVKIVMVNDQEIYYRRCGEDSGPLIKLFKAHINHITYSRKTKEELAKKIINPADSAILSDTGTVSQHNSGLLIHPLATTSVGMGICSYIPFVGWVFAILGITFGSIALSTIRKHPEKYTGEKRANLGITLGGIGLLVGALVLITILLSL